ncbi:hypothetical protein HAX54_006711 [Datura stramonium]|uniref:Uncharacterized protein n=1 Tax=Datura stramonium TaxID=4076 RepID=A0ABS8TC23_DATST|nr:hypothetical protein [Datura stramonium]
MEERGKKRYNVDGSDEANRVASELYDGFSYNISKVNQGYGYVYNENQVTKETKAPPPQPTWMKKQWDERWKKKF